MKFAAISTATHYKLSALALALMTSSAAFAATSVTTSPLDPGTATDSSRNSTAVKGSADSASFSLSKYNGGGVLTGVAITAQFGSETVKFSTTGRSTVSGSAQVVGGFSVGGVTGSQTTEPVSASGVTSSNSVQSTFSPYSATASATTQSQLNAFYGTGNIGGSVTEALKANLASGTRLSVNNVNNNTATVSATYTALNHANGGFDATGGNTLTLNFGDIANGTAAEKTFNLYNVLGSYGLHVVSVRQTAGNRGAFSLGGDALTQTDLAGDSFASGVVNFAKQTVVGAYTGTWRIRVADSTFGIAAGRNTRGVETLTLNVTANVTPVPEPETYSMMFAGLALMGAVVRRRTNKKA